MKLDDAISSQIVRMAFDESVQKMNTEDTELRSLLQAFISLISAYLQRLGETSQIRESPQPKVSDTFGSLG